MKFSNTHEWVETKDNVAIIGVSNFGRMHLGVVVNIKLPSVGKKVIVNEEVVVLESNKAAVDIHSPVSGEIIEVNDELNNNINILNTSPEEKGWLFKIIMDDPSQVDGLMSFDEYEKKVSK